MLHILPSFPLLLLLPILGIAARPLLNLEFADIEGGAAAVVLTNPLPRDTRDGWLDFDDLGFSEGPLDSLVYERLTPFHTVSAVGILSQRTDRQCKAPS